MGLKGLAIRSARLKRRERERAASEAQLIEMAKQPDGPARIERVEREAARRRQRAASDLVDFVWRYVKILDPDDGIIPFHLFRLQALVLQVFLQERRIIILKARQLGITWLVIAYCIWRCIHTPGYTAIIISRDEDAVKEVFKRVRIVLENLPLWLIRERGDVEEDWPGPLWNGNILSCTFTFPEGPDSRIIGEQQSASSGRSFAASLIVLDEWGTQEHAEEIWNAAGPTVNRSTGGQVIGLSTMEHGTFFQKMWESAMTGLSAFFPIFLPWHSDPRRDKKWYEATKREYPNTYKREYPASPAEALEQGVRQSFRFDKKIHVVPERPIPDGWTILRTLDWGYHTKFALYYLAVGPDDEIEICRELYGDHTTVAQVCEQMRKVEALEDIKPLYGVADPNIGEKRGGSGPSIAEEFEREGFIWERADRDRQKGWDHIHLRLASKAPDGTPKLRVQAQCVNFIWEIERAISTPDGRDSVDKRKCSDHALDSVRYGIVSRPPVPKSQKKNLPPWQTGYDGLGGPTQVSAGSWMSW